MKAEMAAEAEGGVASPNLDGSTEVEVEVFKSEDSSSRLINVEVGEDGEVVQPSNDASAEANEKNPVRRMMDVDLDSEEDKSE